MDWNEIIRIFIIMWFSYLIVDSIFRHWEKHQRGCKKKIIIYTEKGKG
nr:MAG TPA: hypothetical protein [Caudoviricetes sp.]